MGELLHGTGIQVLDLETGATIGGRQQVEYDLSGDWIFVQRCHPALRCLIQIESKSAPPIRVQEGEVYQVPGGYKRIFVSHESQFTAGIALFIGSQRVPGDGTLCFIAGKKGFEPSCGDRETFVVQGQTADAVPPALVGGITEAGLAYTIQVDDAGVLQVTGKLADGGALNVGVNPVLVAGQDGTNVQSILTDVSGRLLVDLATWGGVALLAAANMADGLNNGVGPIVATRGGLFNGASWDRARSNLDLTFLASAARTATTPSASQANYNGRGLQIWLKITAASGTGGLVVRAYGQDPISGAGSFLNAAPVAITAVGTYGYEIYPGATTAGAAGDGNIQQRTAASVPRRFVVQVEHGDASSYTYSLGGCIIL